METSVEANLTKEPMSALIFVAADCVFFDQNLKHKQKAYSIFFQISLFDVFCGLCPLDFVFVFEK